MLKKIIDFLFPQHCFFCLQKTLGDLAVCHDCYQSLPWSQNNQSIITAFNYQSPIDQVITQFKFYEKLHYCYFLAYSLSEVIQKSQNALPELIIPVPLHNKKLSQRGFNQSIEIAKIVSLLLQIPLDYHSVHRIKNTKAQSCLKRNARQINLNNAFRVDKKILTDHVAVIDDVITTGATINALKKVLLQSGVKKVSVWCCASSTVKPIR